MAIPRYTRRSFLGRTSSVALTAGFASWSILGEPRTRRWRAAIMGATGQGDYGHSLDAAFQGIDPVQVVALSDPNEAGRKRVAQRIGCDHHYSDYREMLEREKPDLVVVAPRWSLQHFEMAKSALEAGAHILTEKPFTVSLIEADQLLRIASQRGLKIAVAHQMRMSPGVGHLHRLVSEGLIGEVIAMRSWGKQDKRAGGEDLMVLGTHIFDMMRYFVGDATACLAQVTLAGKKVSLADAHDATEQIGPIAGDEIEAQFEFDHSVHATFCSRARLRESLGPWALEIWGSQGAVRIMMDIDPIVLQLRRSKGADLSTVESWVRLSEDPTLHVPAEQQGFGPANRRVVLDWLNAIEQDREPECSGKNAMKALECVMAVYQSALAHGRVSLPLIQREHPLM